MLHRLPPAKSLYSSTQSSSRRWCLGTPHLRIGFSVAGHRRRDGKDDDSTPTFVVRRNLCIVRGCCGSSRLPYSHSFAVDNLRRFPNRKPGSSALTADLWQVRSTEAKSFSEVSSTERTIGIGSNCRYRGFPARDL